MKNLITLTLISLLSINLMAQEDIGYQKPSATILELAEFTRAPSISMDTKKEYMLLSYRNTYKSLEDLNQTEMRLGGLRINPVTNISSSQTYVSNIKLRKVSDTNKEPIQILNLPASPKIANVSWSHDDKKIAFTHTTLTGVELWVVDVATAKASKLTEAKLNANLGSPYNWLNDNKSLLVKFKPLNSPALIDEKTSLPKGPTISSSSGQVSQNRTYQDLLRNKNDESNFETLVSAELFLISLDGKKVKFKDKDLYISQSFSPDGKYLMLTKVNKPFSYIVPFTRFPQQSDVYGLDGKLVKTVNEVPLSEIMPKGFMAVRAGKRNMSWRNDLPASLSYVEALDGGDPAVKVEHRDELFTWSAPFSSTAVSLTKTINRMAGAIWGDSETALVFDNWYDTRNVKTYLINPSKTGSVGRIISDRNSQDIYSDPGNYETKENQYGKPTLAKENNKLFLLGDGFTKEGQFPFIDELDLGTLKTNRLYSSKIENKKEDILSIEDFKTGKVLAMIQSKNEYPNYFFRNIQDGSLSQITNFKNPFGALEGIRKEVIKYKREDGVELSGNLYVPKNFDGVKRPLLIWAYPEEFKDKNSAGQNSKNPNEFTFPSYGSFIYWVNKGYVVLDDASFPIIGEGTKEPNDSFIDQLVASGKAAIDAVDALGLIDRSKVAVGGHSYGAFMTANLLTHSDLFACGIARSGAYNRTLTPFGFQTEQRNFWDVPEVYSSMSPFFNAQKMKKPILLIHGEADNNPGTFTLQTERYYQALKGLGAKARMVILPKEAHGYVAKENIMHMLWEQEQFLDKHLMNK